MRKDEIGAHRESAPLRHANVGELQVVIDEDAPLLRELLRAHVVDDLLLGGGVHVDLVVEGGAARLADVLVRVREQHTCQDRARAATVRQGA
eukprot:5991613-Prymnesium_polylepis.2